jgi:hypothetical protein
MSRFRNVLYHRTLTANLTNDTKQRSYKVRKGHDTRVCCIYSAYPDGGLSSKIVIHEAERPLRTHSAKEAPLVEEYRMTQPSAGSFCIYISP